MATAKVQKPDPDHASAEDGPYSLATRLLERYGRGERLLVSEEVAEILRVSPLSLGRWRTTGEGPSFVKLGRGRTALIRYRLTDVVEYVARSVRRSTSDPGPA